MAHSFVSLLLIFTARHFDRPLPQSSSRVCRDIPKLYGLNRKRRLSVVDIGRKNPLIPGQQLCGGMIPRPEYDEKIHQYQRIMAEQKMNSFKECVKRINGLDGLSDFERRQLIKSQAMAGTPMSIGYEVALLEKSESMLTDTDSSEDTKSEGLRSNLLRSVSVRLVSDKTAYVSQRETKDLILESDGHMTYCISENDEYGEEGMEIIGTDRLPSSYGRLPSSYDIFPSDELAPVHEESLFRSDISKVRTDISQVSSSVDDPLACVFECNEEMEDACSPKLDESLLKQKVE